MIRLERDETCCLNKKISVSREKHTETDFECSVKVKVIAYYGLATKEEIKNSYSFAKLSNDSLVKRSIEECQRKK